MYLSKTNEKYKMADNSNIYFGRVNQHNKTKESRIECTYPAKFENAFFLTDLIQLTTQTDDDKLYSF